MGSCKIQFERSVSALGTCNLNLIIGEGFHNDLMKIIGL